MPLYLFKNPKTNKIISVFQAMNDDHSYSENGIKYERIFTVPNASIDSQIDPNSSFKDERIKKVYELRYFSGEEKLATWNYTRHIES